MFPFEKKQNKFIKKNEIDSCNGFITRESDIQNAWSSKEVSSTCSRIHIRQEIINVSYDDTQQIKPRRRLQYGHAQTQSRAERDVSSIESNKNEM